MKSKAFVIRDADTRFFAEVDVPEITQPDDVIVKVKSVGICGSDLHIFHGNHFMSIGHDRIPGHEFAGVVQAVGSGVKDLKVGDRVVHEPIKYCGKCYACRHNQGNVCRYLQVTGCNCSGGMQEYFNAPERQWHKIPDWMSWKQAAVVEPYTIAAQSCAQGKVAADDIVLIHGAGPIGLMCIDTAKHFGAKVICSARREGRQRLAREMGADYVLDPSKDDVYQSAMDLTGGVGVTVILDCAGVPDMMEKNMEMLQPAGRFVPVATCPIHIEDGIKIMLKQLTIVGSRHQSGQFDPVIARFELYAEHANKIITDIFPFEKIDEAFQYAAARHPETGKCVILFDEQ